MSQRIRGFRCSTSRLFSHNAATWSCKAPRVLQNVQGIPSAASTKTSQRSFSETKRGAAKSEVLPLKLGQLPSYLYPERLLIYNSGTFRTTFLAIIKVTAVFSFLGSLWVNAYPQLMLPDGSTLEAMRIAAVSAIPPTMVHVFTHPYVATISLQLPRRARVSLPALRTFSHEFGPKTQLSITTVRPWGTSKTWQLAVEDLEKVKPRVARLENYVTKRGKNSIFGFGERFFVGDVARGEKNARVPGIWQEVTKFIESRTAQGQPSGKP